MSQGEIASHFLRKREFLSQNEMVSVSNGNWRFFPEGHYFLLQGRQRLSQKEVVTNSRRSCLFIFSGRDWLCHKERRSLSRGDFASLLFMKRLLFSLLRWLRSQRETVPLRFREKFSLSQKEDVCFSREDRLPRSPREIGSVAQGNCFCLTKRLPFIFSERGCLRLRA